VFKLGLPHTHDSLRSHPQALEYFKNELVLLRRRLGDFAGHQIQGREIRRAISLCNDIRELLRTFFEYPKQANPPLGWYDSFLINQAGFLINRRDFLTELKHIERELQRTQFNYNLSQKARVMLTGSFVGIGDHKILDLIHDSGGNIVADGVCTGLSNARRDVTIFGIMGDPLDALAERYLYNVPCPCTVDLDRRLKRTAAIAQDFQVSGVIYYNLKFCDTWRFEFQMMKDYLSQELKIPILLVESDYSPSDMGTIRTKIEAFIEMIRGI
jgi:benzoyl-CoA reductase/2-hydroxyglutaryl-CoA dehydratase subunit BcrC/BadD/HgdB